MDRPEPWTQTAIDTHYMARLPTELIIQIIQDLGTPSHSLAYSLPKDSSSSLWALCLTSRACHTIALPYLYRRIVISRTLQISLLLRVIPYLRLHTQSLAICPLPFESHIHEQTCALLHELSGNVQRLLINCWGGATEQERCSLAACTRLREFIMPQEYYHWGLYVPSDPGRRVTLPSTWDRIERLSLYRIHLDAIPFPLLAQCPRLTGLCLSDCWLPPNPENVAGRLSQFSISLASLKHLYFLVYTDEAASARELITCLRTALLLLRAETVIGLRVVNVLEDRYKGGIPGVLTELARLGTLWDPASWNTAH